MPHDHFRIKKNTLELPHGKLSLPTFLPDGTYGFVRSLDSDDLIRCGVQGMVMNAFHLMQRPGSSVIKKFGGLHELSNWNYPIITDSGGFQVYSMIRQKDKYGTITGRGILFRPENSQKKINITPEKSIRLQLSFGADIVICLDECTHVDDSFEVQENSVRRTINWAKRCKVEFERILKQKNISETQRPLIFAVIQGGRNRELRKNCADALLEIGFDGFGYGGYPLDRDGNLLIETISYTRRLVPDNLPMIALGIGNPMNVVTSAMMGYTLFDSSLPTRDARRGRLYVFKPEHADFLENEDSSWYSYLYIQDKKHIGCNNPVSKYCDCLTCSNYSLAFLHHLFRRNDALFFRLATIHNLRFMMIVMGKLREYERQSQ